jgi:hypothetical protein
MKPVFIAAFFALALSGLVTAQDFLVKSPDLPVADGSVRSGEYQYNTTASGMKIGATLGKDGMLYLYIEVATQGWVALGFGSPVMDGAHLFLAYDSAGKQVLSEQDGSGHSHSQAAASLATKWAVKTASGSTVLELVVPASAAIKDGSLKLLASYATGISFFQKHAARTSLSISVKN